MIQQYDMEEVIIIKRIIAVCLLFLTAALAAGCTSAQEQESSMSDNTAAAVRLGGLKGPTSIGMVKLLDDAEQKQTDNSYTFTMAGSADELTPKLLKGELDILAVPANLASVLYNNSDGAVQVIAVNTLGVLSIAEKGGNDINSIADLKGKKILASGKGSTPEYALDYLLKENGIDTEQDVEIEWKSEPSEIVAEMAASEYTVAMLPQPYAAVAAGQFDDLHLALDLTEEWDALDNDSRLITAVLAVRKEFAEQNADAIQQFLAEYKQSTDYVNQNPADASLLVEKYDIVKAAIAEKAIPNCNIVCITGNEMQESLDGYLHILYDMNSKSVGGKVPDEQFYRIYE